MKLELEVFRFLHLGWRWTIYSNELEILRTKSFRTEEEAGADAQEFINKCLVDRSTWPKQFK